MSNAIIWRQGLTYTDYIGISQIAQEQVHRMTHSREQVCPVSSCTPKNTIRPLLDFAYPHSQYPKNELEETNCIHTMRCISQPKTVLWAAWTNCISTPALRSNVSYRVTTQMLVPWTHSHSSPRTDRVDHLRTILSEKHCSFPSESQWHRRKCRARQRATCPAGTRSCIPNHADVGLR